MRRWRTLAAVFCAALVLLLAISCAGSGAAIQQGWVRPPRLQLRFVHGTIGQISTFNLGCGPRGRDPRPQSRYIVVLYTPFAARLSLPIGHVLVDRWVPC